MAFVKEEGLICTKRLPACLTASSVPASVPACLPVSVTVTGRRCRARALHPDSDWPPGRRHPPPLISRGVAGSGRDRQAILNIHRLTSSQIQLHFKRFPRPSLDYFIVLSPLLSGRCHLQTNKKLRSRL